MPGWPRRRPLLVSRYGLWIDVVLPGYIELTLVLDPRLWRLETYRDWQGHRGFVLGPLHATQVLPPYRPLYDRLWAEDHPAA